MVPLGRGAGPFVLPTHETVADHSYPLVQVITVFFDPSSAQAPTVRAFLRYVLSEQGQQAVREDGGYTALTPAIAAAERRKLR